MLGTSSKRCCSRLAVARTGANHAALVHVWKASDRSGEQPGPLGGQCASERAALRHSRLAGQQRTGLFCLQIALAYGPTPAEEALERLDRLLPESPDPYTLGTRAWLLAMLDRFDEAVPLARESNKRLRDLDGRRFGEARLAEIAAYRGDHETAAAHLRELCEWLEEQGLLGYLATFAGQLGRELCVLGRFEEAEPFAQRGHEVALPQDVTAQSMWRQVQSLVLAHRGDLAEGERLAREAVAIMEQTDSLNLQGETLRDLAEVLHAAGRAEEAAATLVDALDRFERKRNLPMARQVRERLSNLQASAPPL